MTSRYCKFGGGDGMRKAQVFHSQHNTVHVVRYIGWVNYAIAPSLRQFFEVLLGEEKVTGMVFDLTRVLSIDSTNLGLLARTAIRFRERHATCPVLVTINEELRAFLRSMSFQEIFQLTDENALSAEGQSVGLEIASKGNMLNTMLEAHRALADISDDNRDRFAEVVMWLESEEEKRLRS